MLDSWTDHPFSFYFWIFFYQNAKRIVAAGVTGPEGHPQSRPEDVEQEAVNRAIMLAHQTNCPLYVVHVMGKDAAKEIANARRKGRVVFGETIAAGLASNGENYYRNILRFFSQRNALQRLTLRPWTLH